MTEEERDYLLEQERLNRRTGTLKKLEPQEIMKVLLFAGVIWWGVIEGNIFKLIGGFFVI